MQLRRPPLLGAWAFRNRRAITAASALLCLVGLPLGALYALGESELSDSVVQTVLKFVSLFVVLLVTLVVGGLVLGAVVALVNEPGTIADDRATLCTRVGWLRLELHRAGEQGEVEKALERIRELEAQLERR